MSANIKFICTSFRNKKEKQVFLVCFAMSANKSYIYRQCTYIYRQCTYIVFILQCQKVQNNCYIALKKAETRVPLIVFNGVFFNVRIYTVTICYRSST